MPVNCVSVSESDSCLLDIQIKVLPRCFCREAVHLCPRVELELSSPGTLAICLSVLQGLPEPSHRDRHESQVLKKHEWSCTELSTEGSLFWNPTQPHPPKRWPDPTRPALADKKSDSPQFDPTPSPYILCFTSSKFKSLTWNNIYIYIYIYIYYIYIYIFNKISEGDANIAISAVVMPWHSIWHSYQFNLVYFMIFHSIFLIFLYQNCTIFVKWNE